MRSPLGFINNFCRKHPDFGIPNLMRYICIGNVVFWMLSIMNPNVLSFLTFSPYHILHGQIWRIISFVFYPPSTSYIAFIAIYFYYFIGNILELNWGTAHFNVYFMTGVLLTVIYGFAAYFITGANVPISATYIYLSMFFSFAVLFPDMQVLLFFILPIKIKYLALVDAVFFAYDILRYLGNFISTHYVGYLIYGLLPLIAILNFFIFCGGGLLSFRVRKRTATEINFKKESARIRKEQEQNLYFHRCSVCGRTDKDFPNLEFRYCSRCEGYHCFCEDHIYSHVHFKE